MTENSPHAEVEKDKNVHFRCVRVYIYMCVFIMCVYTYYISKCVYLVCVLYVSVMCIGVTFFMVYTASKRMGTCMMLSSWSTTSLEEVAEVSGSGLRWFQLYVYRDRALTRNLVLRAEKAGYQALVITVDAPVVGKRLADARNRFSLPPHLHLANFSTDTPQSTLTADGTLEGSYLERYTRDLLDPGLTWEGIQWIRSLTTLPVLVKGILTAEDAVEAVRCGVQAIVVSNHGGRQLDGVLASVGVFISIPVSVFSELCFSGSD